MVLDGKIGLEGPQKVAKVEGSVGKVARMVAKADVGGQLSAPKLRSSRASNGNLISDISEQYYKNFHTLDRSERVGGSMKQDHY